MLVTPNIVEAASLQELSELVGFEVRAEFSLPFEAEETVYRAYWNELAEVAYSGGEHTAIYRQSLGTGDLSGDYTPYSDTAEITAGHRHITLKGDNGVYVLAIWTDGEYAFSLSVSPGLAESGWRESLSR